ncbi:MAG: FAD-dependent oxidoreductase [Chloroflexi bacterium]|nr:FAD-dependent oxidoreductase [Chloroflexota bacterium]
MIDRADAVVVGAGAFGASVAYHLARRGRHVALLERHAVASQTSPRAAGLTQQIRTDPVMTRLAIRSVEKIEQFQEDTGEPLEFHQSGSLKIARTPRFAEQIADEIERGRRAGLQIDAISPRDARQLAPFLDSENALAIWYNPSDLYLEPGDLPRAYVRAAEKLGASILPNTAVTGVRTRAGSIEQVVTERGEVETPVVVDAAGAWAALVADMTGIRVPIVPTRHQLYITRPIEGVEAEQPIVRVLDVNVYVRPERGGLMVGGYEPDPLQVDMRQMPEGFQIQDLALDFEPLRRLTDEVSGEFPVLQSAEVAEFRGGLPTMTADGRHIVDRVPGVEGLFVAGGCCVGGLSISPAVGEVLADWVVDGHPSEDMRSLSLSRFGPELASDRALRERCLWRYAHHYSDEQSAR